MDVLTESVPTNIAHNDLSGLHARIDECLEKIHEHWEEYPELYRMVQLQNQLAASKKVDSTPPLSDSENIVISSSEIKEKSFLYEPLRGAPLRAKILQSHREIRGHVLEMNADIIPRTAAHNRKCEHQSIDEERGFRADIVSSQIQAWRGLLPTLIRRFSKIPDYRNPKSIKHKITVLMIFGLFAFIFRLKSRREMNKELTSPVIVDHLKKIFPEIESIPHADTLARLLKKINPREIEEAHIDLIKDLINKKKFKQMLINDCLPISVDGAQKLFRDGLLQDDPWCTRSVGKEEDDNKQQYIYALEANITLKNGLTIPLMTEFLYREKYNPMQPTGKQDSETTAFERLSKRIKNYFPRLKMIFFMDAMFATQSVMGILHKYHWEYIIRLPKKKLTSLAKYINASKSMMQPIPGQPAYRKRKQEFYWQNDIPYGYEWQLTIHLAACFERYEEVDKKTGEIVKCFSEHTWISSIRVNIHKVHELFNLGARKQWLIEDSTNTEKNRGYHYKHAYSYNWNAMQGFHYLMRLGHAINAICEFTKKLKKYIRELGCSATIKLIKETLCSPWLSSSWYEEQALEIVQLRLHLE